MSFTQNVRKPVSTINKILKNIIIDIKAVNTCDPFVLSKPNNPNSQVQIRPFNYSKFLSICNFCTIFIFQIRHNPGEITPSVQMRTFFNPKILKKILIF